MTPIDYRNETFASLEGRLRGQRAAVLAAWREHGPCTTEELAERAGMSILTLRPRTTELVQMGFVRLSGDERSTKGGTYRAASYAETLDHFHTNRREAMDPQLHLEL